jgi:hypothetical protein
MKATPLWKAPGNARRRLNVLRLLAVMAAVTSGISAPGAEEPAAKEEVKAKSPTPEQMFEGGDTPYVNWIELSAGAFLPRGDEAQAQERHRLNQGAFGGIEDLHYQHDLAKSTTLSLDGRGIYDNHDYSLSLGVKREEAWFVRLNLENFRTWSNDDGGVYSPTGVQYTRSDDALALDRGKISFEAGLTLKDKPSLHFKYTHAYRDGEKSSTSWGQTHPEYNLPGGNFALVRGISPTFYDIDETRDLFELDARHRIKATDVGLSLRYEAGDLDDARKISRFPGEPTFRAITDRQGESYDSFGTHAYTETWIQTNLFLSTGFLFVDQWGDFSGSRIFGDDFDVRYSANPTNGLGYTNLLGSFNQQEYVLNVNLMSMPVKHLVVVPSLRVRKEFRDTDSSGWQTLGANPATLADSESDRDLLEVCEQLDIRYSGVTNWVFYARGVWTQGDGNLEETGGMGMTAPVDRETDDSRFFQKYGAGARWYLCRAATLDLGGYYKDNDYDYDHRRDSTLNSAGNRYPAYLVMQDFQTGDANVRLTLKPARNVTLTGRYDYQLSTVHTRPDSASGLGDAESLEMTSHIFALYATWVPWSRLYLQAGGNYVISKTESPTSDAAYTQAILDAQNNYLTVNCNAGFVVNEKTDLNVGYFFYLADNFEDNSATGLPLGMGADEHGVTAAISRRISKNMRLNLRYGYFRSDEDTFGGNNHYAAHTLFSSLQYRF